MGLDDGIVCTVFMFVYCVFVLWKHSFWVSFLVMGGFRNVTVYIYAGFAVYILYVLIMFLFSPFSQVYYCC